MRIREMIMDVETKATIPLAEVLEQSRLRIAAITKANSSDVVIKQVVPSGDNRFTVMFIVKLWDPERGIAIV